MKKITDSFQTSDKLKLHTAVWLPEGEARAVVLISHGLGEHFGRYDHVAALLVEQGYAVYGLDHRGHGQSEGARAYFDSFEPAVADLKQYFDQVKAAQPDKKIFLYGHSLGSLIGLAFVLRHQQDLAGYLCSGATLELESSQPALLIRLLSVMNALAPKLALPPISSKYLSHDPAVVAAYDADPLVHHGGVSARMVYLIVQVSRMVKARLGEIKLPLLVFHGGDDKICPPAGSDVLHRGAASADKTLKRYDTLYHEVHNEPEKEVVLADIMAWLNRH